MIDGAVLIQYYNGLVSVKKQVSDYKGTISKISDIDYDILCPVQIYSCGSDLNSADDDATIAEYIYHFELYQLMQTFVNSELKISGECV